MSAASPKEPPQPQPPPPDGTFGEQMKSKGGLIRIWRAATYSRDGLLEAFQHEHAFRQELFVIVPLSGVAIALTATGSIPLFSGALLLCGLLLVLLVELLNSALESCVDHISLERHPLAKRAKDMGSAAVSIAMLMAALLWAAVLWSAFA
jgi:diacylglycerol kinase (ATP)